MKTLSFLPAGALLWMFATHSYAQSSIKVNGTYTGNQTWQADTVKITGDVYIDLKLTILPGTYVEFQGHYELSADVINAVGSVGDSITFTVHDTTGFSNRKITNGGWKKISVTNSAKFDYCRFMYGKNINSALVYWEETGLIKTSCYSFVFKNSCFINNYSVTRLFEDHNMYQNCVKLSDCLFKCNDFGRLCLGIATIKDCFFYENSFSTNALTVKGSIFEKNTRLEFGWYYEVETGFYNCVFHENKNLSIKCNTDSYLHLYKNKIINNENFSISCYGSMYGISIIGNIICNNILKTGFNFDGPDGRGGNTPSYIINNTICNNHIKDGTGLITISYDQPRIHCYNNVLYGNGKNNPEGIQLSFINADGSLKEFYGDLKNNLIEGAFNAIKCTGISGIYENNFDAKPVFLNPEEGDFSLAPNSPGINAGDSLLREEYIIETNDLLGNPRIVGEDIDMGACEFQGFYTNTKPSLINLETLRLKKNETGYVIIHFYDPDTLDTHKITLSNPTGFLNIFPTLYDAADCAFTIVPSYDWEGKDRIYVQVTDSYGNVEIDSFKVIVYDGLCGSIPHDTVLGPGIVHVMCDISVEEGANMEIMPGTTLLFEGNYSLSISGRIKAEGTRSQPIIFTASDTTGYLHNEHSGWGGIIFTKQSTDDTVLFKHCYFSFAKLYDWDQNLDLENYGVICNENLHRILNFSNCVFEYSCVGLSGAIIPWGNTIDSSLFRYNYAPFIVGDSRVKNSEISFCNGNAISGGRCVENCIVRNNVGTGIFGIVDVYGCIISNNTEDGISRPNGFIVNNLVIGNGGRGIYLGYYRRVKIINNTILNNRISGVFLQYNTSIPLYNNIIYGNGNISTNNISIIDYEGAKPLDLFNCLLEGGKSGINLPKFVRIYENNIDGDPEFVQPSQFDFHLKSNSPCINNGTPDTTGLSLPVTDLDGNPRVADLYVDMGAYEYNSSAFEILHQPEGIVTCSEGNDTLVANACGGVTAYQWQRDGVDLTDADDRMLTFTPLSKDISGKYNCIIKTADRTFSTDTVDVSVLSVPEIIEQTRSFGICEKQDMAISLQVKDTGSISYAWYRGDEWVSKSDKNFLEINGVSLDDEGVYLGMASNRCGTDSTSPIQVTVYPLPAIDLGGPYEICDHDSIRIGTSAAYHHYQWSSGANSPFVFVCSEGNYWLEVIDTNGCRNKDTTSIIVHPLPYIYLGEDTILHTNDALTLDAGGGFDSYFWNTGAGTQVLPVNTTQTGEYEYWVRVSDSNSCAATDTIFVTVELPDAMPGYTKVFGLKVYPNPTTGIVYLVPQSEMDGEVLITVIDAGGRMIHKDKLSSLKTGAGFSIDLSEFENGLYLLMIDQYPVRIIKNSE